VNLLGEPAAREYLDGLLSVRGQQVERERRAFIELGDLRLQEFLGIDCFDPISDQVSRIIDDAYITLVPLGWQRSGRRSPSLRTVDSSRVGIFVRRIAFSWGALLILDNASPERQLLLATWGGVPGGYPPDAGERPVVGMGFVGNQAQTFNLIFTHCDTKDGCVNKRPGCTCSEVLVSTKHGDEAWACMCEPHNST
jgi:hypothetical protein